MAEFQLYVKTSSFVSHIEEKYINSNDPHFLDDFPNSIKKLWIDLYENGFVEIEDVNSVVLWLKALSEIGYTFPGKTTTFEETSMSEKNNFSGGKSLYELSSNYIAKLYNGSPFLNSTCIENSTGNVYRNF